MKVHLTNWVPTFSKLKTHNFLSTPHPEDGSNPFTPILWKQILGIWIRWTLRIPELLWCELHLFTLQWPKGPQDSSPFLNPSCVNRYLSSQCVHALRVAELDRWMLRTCDKGDVQETDLHATIESSEKWYRNTMKKRGLSPHPDPEQYLKWWVDELDIR